VFVLLQLKRDWPHGKCFKNQSWIKHATSVAQRIKRSSMLFKKGETLSYGLQRLNTLHAK